MNGVRRVIKGEREWRKERSRDEEKVRVGSEIDR